MFRLPLRLRNVAGPPEASTCARIASSAEMVSVFRWGGKERPMSFVRSHAASKYVRHRIQLSRFAQFGLLAIAGTGCAFVFGPVCKTAKNPIEARPACVQRDMPTEWRNRGAPGKPVMFNGAGNSWDDLCFYQVGESETLGSDPFFGTDDKGNVWRVDCDGRLDGLVYSKPQEIYKRSVEYGLKRSGHTAPVAGSESVPAPPSVEAPQRECRLNSDCPTGKTCHNGKCLIECREDRDCTGGKTCTTDGRCK